MMPPQISSCERDMVYEQGAWAEMGLFGASNQFSPVRHNAARYLTFNGLNENRIDILV